MDDTTPARIADEAYVKGLRSTTATDRAYAHGVEDLAHLLAGGTEVNGALVSILDAAGLRSLVSGVTA